MSLQTILAVGLQAVGENTSGLLVTQFTLKDRTGMMWLLLTIKLYEKGLRGCHLP